MHPPSGRGQPSGGQLSPVVPFPCQPMTHDPGFPRPDSRLIETNIGLPPAETTPVSQQGLPEDLLREAAQRLGLVCLISGGLWLSNWLAVHLIHPMPGTFRIGELAMHRERPASARELCDRLARCEVEAAWTREDARVWWETRLEPEVAVSLVD